MDTSIYNILIIALISLALLYFFSTKAKVKRKLKRANYKKIADFEDGDVAKIVGNVELVDKPLIASFTNRKCSYYHVKVIHHIPDGDDGGTYNTIIEKKTSIKFLIKDELDFAVINCDKLKTYVVLDKEYSSGLFDNATKEMEDFLNTHGCKSTGLLGFNKSLEYWEGVLEEGEEIAVYGKGVWKDAKELNLPEEYGKVLEITSAEQDAVYLSDDLSTTKRR